MGREAFVNYIEREEKRLGLPPITEQEQKGQAA
jgi:hypothetical protein